MAATVAAVTGALCTLGAGAANGVCVMGAGVGTTGAGALGRLKPTHVRVYYDAHQEEADVLVGLVTSTTSVGGFKTTRDLGISLNDGLYEMILVRATKNLAEFNLAATRALRLDFDNDSFISAQTGALRFEFDEPVAWTVDGEFGGSVTEVEIHNERRAIDIIVP